MSAVEIGPLTIGGGGPLVLIAGPCVIEDEAHTLKIAAAVRAIALDRGMPCIFKASFDKANRTSLGAYRGPGLEQGLRVLASVKAQTGLPVLTDIHEPAQAARVAEVADILQIPAFLSRQTDLIVAAARTGRAVNLKKGQFLSPRDMRYAVEKVVQSGNPRVFVTERGTSFGYNNLVVDMRALPQLRELGCPVVFDATHSLQLPGGGEGRSTGQARYVATLAAAAVAAGVDGVFMEVHDDPAVARSDADNALPLGQLDRLLARLLRVDAAVRGPD